MHLDDALLDAEGRIDPGQWRAAAREGRPVGECDEHGCRIYPGETSRDFYGRIDYTAVCTGTRGTGIRSHGHEAVVPAGRVVRDPNVMPLFGVWQHESSVLDAARERDAAILGEHDRVPA